jgi:hypothetical protein
MPKIHQVIIVPGLGDDGRKLSLTVAHFRKHGLIPVIHCIGWRDGETEFQPKLERLVRLIDQIANEGNRVSLIGCSAGGSAVLNAFIKRKKTVEKVITVCARLKTGNYRGFRSFKTRTASSPAFAQSVRMFEKSEPELSFTDRQKIMTIHPLFGDELVPADMAVISGATNICIPTFEHILSITLALTLFSGRLMAFL